MECMHSLVCDLGVLAEGSVLLVRYRDMAKYDGEVGWFLPDDVLHHLEHPGRAAGRIAKEQLGVELDEPRLGLIESFRGDDGTWHLSFHHLVELPAIRDIHPSSDVAEARWFPLDDLPARSEVAHHGWALSVLKKMTKAAAR